LGDIDEDFVNIFIWYFQLTIFIWIQDFFLYHYISFLNFVHAPIQLLTYFKKLKIFF
jgi:hypothetical protein